MTCSIVDVAVEAGCFTTPVAAVQAAGLVDTLKGAGPFTVFAPTDAAFAALPTGAVEDLLKPEITDKLVSVLTFHVIPGKVMAADIMGKVMDVATDGVKVGAATVVIPDVDAENDLIHVIDTVIMAG